MVVISDLEVELKVCQQLAFKGFSSVNGLSWLNELCEIFKTFCERCHIYLKSNNFNKSSTFLCLAQIITCVKNLEKILTTEDKNEVILTTSRQHFLHRMLWCFNKLRYALSDDDNTEEDDIDNNFLDLMDDALDLLSPHSEYGNSDMSKSSQDFNKGIEDSDAVKGLVEILLGQVLAYANVTNESDKKALLALSQKVLRECIAFQKECSIEKSNENMRSLQAAILENALYQIEDFLNESLLRLVFDTFLGYKKYSVGNLKKIFNAGLDSDEIDEKIAEFDLNVDKTIQIGLFAIAFTSNQVHQTTIRNSLASLESLDSYLIPSLQMKSSKFNSQIFCDHFEEEIDNFKTSVQEIIDSSAFCKGYLDILNGFLEKYSDSTTKSDLEDVLYKGQMLVEHFKINIGCLPADNEQLDKFLTMLEECQSITNCFESVSSSKILKRLKILRTVLKRLEKELSGDKRKSIYENDDDLLTMASEDVCQSYKMFESFGISPSIRNILYENSQKGRKASTDSINGNTSKISTSRMNETKVLSRRFITGTLPRRSKRASASRKESMRTLMFKKQTSVKSKSMFRSFDNSAISLDVTDVMELLTTTDSICSS